MESKKEPAECAPAESETASESMGSDEVLEKIRSLYQEHGISFKELEHPPTRTSEESAAARGESMEIGGKAILMKIGDQFRVLVLPAIMKIKSSSIRKFFGIKQMRFATREELSELTGVVPGCMPPFGNPIFPLELYVDSSFQEQDKIAFNAGKLTVSHILAFDDYQRIAKPTFFEFAKPA